MNSRSVATALDSRSRTSLLSLLLSSSASHEIKCLPWLFVFCSDTFSFDSINSFTYARNFSDRLLDFESFTDCSYSWLRFERLCIFNFHDSAIKSSSIVSFNAVLSTLWGRVNKSSRSKILTMDVFVKACWNEWTTLGEKCLENVSVFEDHLPLDLVLSQCWRQCSSLWPFASPSLLRH